MSADLLSDGYIVCDGPIRAEVRIEYGPHRNDEEIAVEYKCGKCGQAYFPELPNEYELSDFLTGMIEAMGDTEKAARRIVAKLNRSKI